MSYFKLGFLVVALWMFGSMVDAATVPFDDVYTVNWGGDHVQFFNERREAQLMMDRSSGAGFQSKVSYGSGFFHMKMKVPNKDSAGVVTTFYLISHESNHDEIDFEFLGNREGKPILLQTNVFTNGVGGREQKISLWFDPTADFHDYRILWNPHQIIFYVDDIPIRVFKNKTEIGVGYPKQAMYIHASIWNGDNWATDGGRTKIDWSHAPFIAHYQGFEEFSVCQSSQNVEECYGAKYWWNESKYWKLNGRQQRELEQVRQKYMKYDYCDDKIKHPTTPLECAFNK